MTAKEAADKLDDLTAKRMMLFGKIVSAARPLVAVLKDAGRTNSAEPLAALFFELDVTDGEIGDLMKDPEVLLLMFNRLRESAR